MRFLARLGLRAGSDVMYMHICGFPLCERHFSRLCLRRVRPRSCVQTRRSNGACRRTRGATDLVVRLRIWRGEDPFYRGRNQAALGASQVGPTPREGSGKPGSLRAPVTELATRRVVVGSSPIPRSGF